MQSFIIDWIVFLILMFSPILMATYATKRYLARKKTRRS